MAEIFRRLLNLSIGATWVVGAVVLVRLLAAKAPKWIRVILWGLVALRLVFPINLQSGLSMVPVSEPIAPVQLTVSPDIPKASVSLPLAEPGATLPPATQTNSQLPVSTPEPEQPLDLLEILGWIWLGGCVLMLGYSALSYWRLRHQLNTAIREDGIWRSEQVRSPFVLGILRPRIYLPFSLQGDQAALVIAHEKAHIRRKDHWWKPLGFLLLSIHWFNPVMWLAYVLLCRDIEFACDEKVIRDMAPELRADYSQALLSCAVHRRQISACPLAFGESGVKGRIRSVLSYKRPAFWLILVGLFACIAVAVFFLTVPKEAESSLTPPLSEIHDSYTLGQAKKDGCLVMEDSTVTSGKAQWEEFLETSRDGEACAIRVVNYYPLGDPSRYDPAYLEAVKDQYPMLFVHDLTFDGKTYTWQGYEDGKLHTETYRYLKEDIEQARTPQATYDYCHRYLLVDNPDVTWDEIFQGLISSQYPNPTPKHASVYTDFIRLPQPTVWFDRFIFDSSIDFSDGGLTYILDEYPQVTFHTSGPGSSITATWADGETYTVSSWILPEYGVYFCDLTGDGIRDLCASVMQCRSGQIYTEVLDPIRRVSYELPGYTLCMANDYLCVAQFQPKNSSQLSPMHPLLPIDPENPKLSYWEIPVTLSDIQTPTPVLPEASPVTVWEGLQGEFTLPELPGVKLYRSEDGYSIIRQDSAGKKVLHDGQVAGDGYFKDLTGDGVPEFCLSCCFGNGVSICYIAVYDLKEETFYLMKDPTVNNYLLAMEDGKLMVTVTPYAAYYNQAETDAPIKGELALIGSVSGDTLHLGLWSGPIPITNTPTEDHLESNLQYIIQEKFADTGDPGHFSRTYLTILDTKDWGDPVYKEGVIDRTTVYSVFRYVRYRIQSGKIELVFEAEGKLTATVRLAATGFSYLTEHEESLPEVYTAQAETALEAMRTEASEDARQTLTDMLSIHHPWGEDLAMKQIDFDPVQGSMEWSWEQDPAKAPIEYAREKFAYLWEALPVCEIPENFTFPLELFLNTTYSEDTPGSPHGRWKLYRQDGTVYSQSETESLPRADSRVIPVELPGKAGTYVLEVTVYWEDFDTYMRYGMGLVVP